MPKHQYYQRFRNENGDDDHDELLSGFASMSRSCMPLKNTTSSSSRSGRNTGSSNSNSNSKSGNFNDIPAIRSSSSAAATRTGRGSRGSSSSSSSSGVDHLGNVVIASGTGFSEVVDVASSLPASSSSILRIDMDGSVNSNSSNRSTASRNSSRRSSTNLSTSDEDEDISGGGYADGSFPSCNYSNAKEDDNDEYGQRRPSQQDKTRRNSYNPMKTMPPELLSSSVLSTTFQSPSFDSSSSDHNNTEDDAAMVAKRATATKSLSDNYGAETTTTGTTKTWFASRYAIYGCLLAGILLLFLTGLLVGMYAANGSIGNKTTTATTSTDVGGSSSIKSAATISPDSENVNTTISPGGFDSEDAVVDADDADDADDAADEWDVDKEIEIGDEDESTINIAPVTAYWNDRYFRPTASPTTSMSPSVSMTPSAAPSTSPTLIEAEVDVNPIESSSSPLPPRSNYTVGVFYYPAHGSSIESNPEDDPSDSISISRGSNDKGQMFGNYIRKDLVPRQYPMLGEYNDADPDIIKEHIRMLKRANVNLLVTNWSGPGHPSDVNTKSLILPNEDLMSNYMKVALHYDIFNRLPYFEDEDSDTINYSHRSWIEEVVDLARADSRYMCEEYFNHPNFYKLNGRPVVVIDTVSHPMTHVHWVKMLEESLMAIRSEASKCGHFLYLVGNGVVKDGQPEGSLPFWYFDAVTNYVVQTEENSKGYAGKEHVDEYYTHQSKLQDEMFAEDCRFIPTVSPGFNDRSIHPERSNSMLSRRLTEGSEEGTLFYYQLQRAKTLVDPAVNNMILINSFNDWRMDTQVEPVASSPTSSWPPSKTEGLEYDGYDYLYLDILGASTTSIQHQGIFDYLYDM